jgi:hypothetical protein
MPVGVTRQLRGELLACPSDLRGWPLRLSALLSVLLLAATVWLVGQGPAQASQDHPLADWLQGQAKPLETTDPGAPAR